MTSILARHAMMRTLMASSTRAAVLARPAVLAACLRVTPLALIAAHAPGPRRGLHGHAQPPMAPRPSPGRFAISLAAGGLTFVLFKPLFFTVFGAAAGYAAFRLTRAWLDLRYPPRDGYGPRSQPQQQESADDPVAQWLRTQVGVRPAATRPEWSGAATDLATRWSAMARSMVADHLASFTSGGEAVARAAARALERDTALQADVERALGTSRGIECSPPTSVVESWSAVGAPGMAARRRRHVEVTFDASTTAGRRVEVRAAGEAAGPELRLVWVQVDGGARVQLNRTVFGDDDKTIVDAKSVDSKK